MAASGTPGSSRWNEAAAREGGRPTAPNNVVDGRYDTRRPEEYGR